MKMKFKTIFPAYLLLLFISAVPAMALCEGSPPGACYRCEDGVWARYGDCWGGCPACKYCAACWCTKYGDCWGGCPDCHSCVNCNCSCTSDCCSDSDCTGECKSCISCSCVDDDSKCDTAKCYKCVGGSCEYQCDPATQVCCDGTCTPKCEDGEPTGECDTSKNEDYKCPGCVYLLDDCSNYTMREYYGNEVRYCTGGCPGDCVQQNAVECYVEYKCKLVGILWHSCQESPPGEMNCLPNIFSPVCNGCTKDSEEPEPIEYAYPTQCQ